MMPPISNKREGVSILAKGYWVARVDVSDIDAYQQYVKANAAIFPKYGARFLVRGGAFEAMEGTSRSRNVVIEFPSYQAAMDCYESPEYQHSMTFRKAAAESDLVIIEGYDGPQPGD